MRAVLSVLAALVLTAGASLPAMADQPKSTPSSGVLTTAASPLWQNYVGRVRPLYQCPGTHCNQGEARPGPGNWVGEACVLYIGSVKWALVYNYPNGHSGFLPAGQLVNEDPPIDCNNVGKKVAIPLTTVLYQCPAGHCNQGRANQGDDVRGICFVWGEGNAAWIFAFNRTNHHEGFLYYPNHPGGYERC